MRRVNTMLSRLPLSPDGTPALNLALVKMQRRVGQANGLDLLFTVWIDAAAQHFEEQTGRQLITAAYDYWLDSFPPVDRFIELPKPPLQSVLAVTYTDADGETQTIDSDDYTVLAPDGDYARPGRIVLNAGASWPTTTTRERAVQIRFTCGYGDTAEDMPALVQAALLFLVGHFHKHGEEVVEGQGIGLQTVPLGASKMIEAFKYSALPTQSPWLVSWLD